MTCFQDVRAATHASRFERFHSLSRFRLGTCARKNCCAASSLGPGGVSGGLTRRQLLGQIGGDQMQHGVLLTLHWRRARSKIFRALPNPRQGPPHRPANTCGLLANFGCAARIASAISGKTRTPPTPFSGLRNCPGPVCDGVPAHACNLGDPLRGQEAHLCHRAVGSEACGRRPEGSDFVVVEGTARGLIPPAPSRARSACYNHRCGWRARS